MTLAEMASMICSKIGVSDATSLSLCKDYIKRRYSMLWDARDWKDTRVYEPLAVTAGATLTVLPSTVDRVIAARLHSNRTWLDSVDSTLLAAIDTTVTDLIGTTGTPQYYEEIASIAGVHHIRLYPAPASNDTVYIIGKRVRPELTDSTSPIIRGIDNALMAFATADMWERLKQLGKAQAKVQEAGALLETAWKLESEQSNRPRQSKSLTATGNTLGELADDVCARIGDFAPETYILVKQFLRRNYQQLWDSYLWKESRVAVRKASDGSQIILPEYVGRVTALRVNSDLGFLAHVEAEYLSAVTPGVFDETTGTQFGFTQLADVAVHTLPPGYEKLSIASTSASDVGGSVFVYGESNGAEVRETLAQNGTTAVLTSNFYNTPLTITKPANTVGSLVVTGATSGTELLRLGADERERKHIRLWLHPSNTSGTTCLVLGKRRIRPLVNDHDTPMLRDAQAYLIDAATADAFSRFGKPAEAAEARAKAEAARKILISLETAQSANQMRVVPSVESYGGYGEELYGKAYFG